MCRSYTKADVYKPTHGGFINVDIEKDMSISLRTLVSLLVLGTVGCFLESCSDTNTSNVHMTHDACACSYYVQIDHSIVESFGGGGRTCMTARVYPEHVVTGSSHLYVFNNGSDAVKVSKLEAWELASASVNVDDDGGLVGSSVNMCHSEMY